MSNDIWPDVLDLGTLQHIYLMSHETKNLIFVFGGEGNLDA